MTTENTERLFDEIEHYAYDELVASDLNGLSTEDIADLGADLVREASKNWISNNLNDELASAFRTENRAEANLMIEQFKAHKTQLIGMTTLLHPMFWVKSHTVSLRKSEVWM